MDRYKLYVHTIQQASQLCVTSITISSQLKRYTPLTCHMCARTHILQARLHIKVIRCVYTHLITPIHTGGISQGLVDLIGYHFICHHTSISIHQLYPHLSSSSRYNICQWSFYKDICWRSILAGVSWLELDPPTHHSSCFILGSCSYLYIFH